jgi:hypothetical protein
MWQLAARGPQCEAAAAGNPRKRALEHSTGWLLEGQLEEMGRRVNSQAKAVGNAASTLVKSKLNALQIFFAEQLTDH